MTTYCRVPGAIDAVVDGEVVVLSPVNLSYHVLDRIGARVWSLLAEPTTDDDLVATLVEQFDVESDQCRADIQPFLTRMIEIGVLTEATTA